VTADRERASAPEEAPRWLGELTAALAATEATDGAGARLELSPAVERTVEMLLRVRAAGRTMLLIGNGGSAAIVGHVHNDLSNALGIRALLPKGFDLVQQQTAGEKAVLSLMTRVLTFHLQTGRAVEQHHAGCALVNVLSSMPARTNERFFDICLLHSER